MARHAVTARWKNATAAERQATGAWLNKISPEERTASARRAAQARWSRVKGQEKGEEMAVTC